MKLAKLIAALYAMLLATSCGHNVIQYGDGVGFDAGINPANYTFSVNLRYGKILSAVTRDNVSIEVDGDTSAEAANGAGTENAADAESGKASVGTDGKLKINIGRQINGYAVELVQAGANPDKVIETLK